MKSLFLALAALFALSACGDFVNSLRRESRGADEEADRDPDAATADTNPRPTRAIRGLSANNVPDYKSPGNRAYGRRLAAQASAPAEEQKEAAETAFHRVTRDDFVDKAPNENSLWDGQGQNNYLFSNNRRRENGDVITADVEKDLRREIQYQLWMGLPPEQRRLKRAPSSMAQTGSDSVSNNAAANAKDGADAAKKAGAPQGAEAKAKDAAEEAAKTNMSSAGSDDPIRMEVVENMGNGLLRLLGQKRVVYRGVSRTVEVAALVNNKDIDDGNHAKSSNFLDMKAQVIQ